ncbi:MAG: DUF4287 domain-containing protein [Xanthomonadales bacterium]|nr:DUF4287 domain-containing protein [Xanthomonadales bacterium]
MSKSPEEAAKTMIANLNEKTGKTLDQWITIARKSGQEKHGAITKYLKSEHGMTHGYANLVAHKTLKSDAGSAGDTDLVATQYSGPKSELKPVYDAVIKVVSKLGNDVEISPKKAYVSLRRKKQFALVQPSTRTRVDLGINLKGEPASGKLELSGSFNAMVSHRVRLEKPADIDQSVKSWLKQAYLQA